MIGIMLNSIWKRSSATDNEYKNQIGDNILGWKIYYFFNFQILNPGRILNDCHNSFWPNASNNINCVIHRQSFCFKKVLVECRVSNCYFFKTCIKIYGNFEIHFSIIMLINFLRKQIKCMTMISRVQTQLDSNFYQTGFVIVNLCDDTKRRILDEFFKVKCIELKEHQIF